MSRLRRPRTGLVLASAIAAFAATACFGGGGSSSPPPPPAACQSVGASSTSAGSNEPSPPPSNEPIPPDQAGAQARQVSSTTQVRTKNGEIPLVTVEEQGGKPVIESTPVRTPDEAAAVAEQKALNGDLHAIDVDKPVKATTTYPTPTDTRFGEQWDFNEVPYVNAWNTDQTQGAGITVAVVDTGVMATHEDLSGQVLTGHSFLHSNDGGTAFEGDSGNSDPNGHGTHVSGTIAALSSNGKGVSGAAPGTKILPVQVLCGDGNGFASDVANGITWAADNGAKVINLSLGGGQSSPEEAAIQHALNMGVVVVAAGGNDGQNGNTPSYPAADSGNYTNLIAVAATTNTDAHASYSTVANYIDISAPGGSACGCGSSQDVLSTVPFSAQEISDPSGYAAIAGTSMATPHVSAAAALLRAANGNCTAAQVKSRLKATATNLGNANMFGAGLVNPNAAGTSCT